MIARVAFTRGNEFATHSIGHLKRGDQGAISFAMLGTTARLVTLLALINSAVTTLAIAGQQPKSSAVPPPIAYHRSNGGPRFSSYDEVTLNADGSVLYKTNGTVGFDWSRQNRAGEFATRVDAALYTRLSQQLTGAMRSGPHRDRFEADSGIETIGFDVKDGAYLRRATGEASSIFDALVKEVQPLKAAALPHPVRAVELSCARGPEMIMCGIRSVGAAPAAAPNLSLARFFCFDRERHMLPIGAPAGLPSPATRVELAPSKAIEFQFPRTACEFHIVLDASEAVLVSNPLSP